MVCFRLQFFLQLFCVYRLIEKQVITGITIHRQLFLFHEELVAEKEFIFVSRIHLCFHDSLFTGFFVSGILCFQDSSLFPWFIFVSRILCFHDSLFPGFIFVSRIHLCFQDSSLFPWFFVSMILCFQDSLFPGFFVSRILCFQDSLFPGFFVSRILCFQDSLFPWFFVSMILCFQDSKDLAVYNPPLFVQNTSPYYSEGLTASSAAELFSVCSPSSGTPDAGLLELMLPRFSKSCQNW